MRRFFHQRVCKRAESLQERLLLGVRQRAERLFEWTRTCREPRADGLLRLRSERDDRPASVCRVLAAGEEAAVLELAGERRGRREREPEAAGELADGTLALAADLGEQRHVAAPE
jgi:hypothetical protein